MIINITGEPSFNGNQKSLHYGVEKVNIRYDRA